MWNGPVKNDWSNVDFSKAPWVNGVAELTHEEVIYVKGQCEIIAVGHETDDFYIQSRYNELTNYEKAINGDTYNVIRSYDPEVNTLGINESGIVQPVEEPSVVEPITEPTTDETGV